MATNLLDLMSPEDRKQAEDAYKKRMSGDSSYRRAKVSPLAYLLAELGIMFGWEAIEAAKRGYVETFDEEDGKKRKIPLPMEELSALADAGRKIKYSDLINQARGTQVATGSVLTKHPNSTFRNGMKPFQKVVEG